MVAKVLIDPAEARDSLLEHGHSRRLAANCARDGPLWAVRAS